jgi:hypothetical protein
MKGNELIILSLVFLGREVRKVLSLWQEGQIE